MIDVERVEVSFAVDAVRKASLLVKHIQKKMVSSSSLTKVDRSPVTIADFAAQAVVGHMLKETFGNDVLVAEESAGTLRLPEHKEMLAQVVKFVEGVVGGATTEDVLTWIDYGGAQPTSRFWTLDPIDGTKGFLRGDQYAVALGLIVNGEVQIGVLGCPNLTDGYKPEADGSGSLIVASRGEGTWVMPLIGGAHLHRLKVSDLKEPTQARLLRSFESGHTNVSQIDMVADALGIEAEPIRMDSQAKYAVLAAGKAELYLRLLSEDRPNYREKIWDQAAGSIVIEEAGGIVTDIDGKPLDFSKGRTLAENRGVCASNGALHAAILDALNAIKRK